MKKSEKRVAQILGVKEGRELPTVSKETLEIYHSYLSENLSFPFDARYSKEAPLEDTYCDVEITGLTEFEDSPEPEFYGLFCEEKRGRRKIVIPLAEVTVKQEGRNKQLIEDYRDWFWNNRNKYKAR